MKKINLKKAPTILVIITISIIIIGLICGLSISGYIMFRLDNLPEMNIDGSDFAPVIRISGYMSLPVISIFIILACLLISIIIDFIIWGTYGIIKLVRKLIKERKWKTLIIIGVSIMILLIMSTIITMINTPILEENTIGYISHDYNSTLGYTIYIKEDNEYVPYLVLTYNYNNTNNALCLRKNVVGGSKYIEDYNGTISKDRIYDGWLEMQSDAKYQETDVDKYLTGEFLKRFDTNLLSKICNTKLSFSEYGYEKGVYHNYELNRQFFILSLTELNYRGTNHDNQTKNTMKLKYFNSNNLMAFNDSGIESPYWTRTAYFASEYYMVGYTGGITTTGDSAKFGVRPAFTIANDTKLTKIYDQNLMQDIYVLDI